MTNQLFRTFEKVVYSMAVIIVITFTGCNGKETASIEKAEVIKDDNTVDIHTAVLTGNRDDVKKYIDEGGDLNVKDSYGSAPLSIAIIFDKTKVAMALIEAGADLSIKNGDGSTPLHLAAFFCRTEVVKKLLTKGADKTAKNNYGSTPLESVLAPYQMVEPFYLQLNKDLGPLGLKLDFDRIEKTRPQIAELLK